MCNECAAWDTSGTYTDALNYEPSADYPSDASTLPNGKLKPVCLSYVKLQEAIDLTHSNLLDDNWHRKNAESYLRTFAMNTILVKKATQQGINARDLQNSDRQPTDCPEYGAGTWRHGGTKIPSYSKN